MTDNHIEPTSSGATTTHSVQTLRRQLQQLGELHASGAFDAATYSQSRTTLERMLVDLVMKGDAGAEIPTVPSAKDARVRPSRRLVAGLSAAVVVFAMAGYWWTGSPAHAGIAFSAGRPVAEAAGAGAGVTGSSESAHPVSPERINEMTEHLALRLKENPDDAEGWAMLARSYSVLGRHVEAIPAYERAVALRADDATLLADYADALAVKNDGRLAGEPMKAVVLALKLDPGNPKALSLAGTDAFDRKDYAAAVEHWQRVVALGLPDSPLVEQARRGAAEARSLGNIPAAVTAATPATASASGAGGEATVSGSVAIAPALAGRASPGDTVFIFARAVAGSRVPLAVLRKQLRDLPLDFRLDDSMAMTSAAKLSNAKQVVVGVRVSKSGNAIAAAGDLVGESGPIALGARGIKIEVANVVSQ